MMWLLGHKSDRDLLLEKAPRLSKNQEEYWRNISVVADLTKKQRELEQSMFKRAEERNLTRSTEEQVKRRGTGEPLSPQSRRGAGEPPSPQIRRAGRGAAALAQHLQPEGQ